MFLPGGKVKNMEIERLISSRHDRELKKKTLTHGDYNIVPYEDARCKIVVSDITCKSDAGVCEIDSEESSILSNDFGGVVLIGNSDYFIDRDIELILQQMCLGETCIATLTYKDGSEKLVKEISCKIELKEVTEEQLISDWSWQRLYESATHHKECGVELVKNKHIADAFRRFSKALKMLIAIEPIDPEVIPEESVKEMIDLKVKLYNNLAHCQLHYNQYEAALDLCNRALKYEANNIKALYRRSSAYTGLHLYEEAWKDIQEVLKLNPSDKSAQQKLNLLKPKVEKIKNEYSNIIKKMFMP